MSAVNAVLNDLDDDDPWTADFAESVRLDITEHGLPSTMRTLASGFVPGRLNDRATRAADDILSAYVSSELLSLTTFHPHLSDSMTSAAHMFSTAGFSHSVMVYAREASAVSTPPEIRRTGEVILDLLGLDSSEVLGS